MTHIITIVAKSCVSNQPNAHQAFGFSLETEWLFMTLHCLHLGMSKTLSRYTSLVQGMKNEVHCVLAIQHAFSSYALATYTWTHVDIHARAFIVTQCGIQ